MAMALLRTAMIVGPMSWQRACRRRHLHAMSEFLTRGLAEIIYLQTGWAKTHSPGLTAMCSRKLALGL